MHLTYWEKLMSDKKTDLYDTMVVGYNRPDWKFLTLA